MGLRWGYAFSLGLTVAVACGGSSQFVIAEHEGCSMEGPERTREGTFEVIVSGDASVAVYALEDDTTPGQVAAHVAAGAVGTTPPGTTRLLRVENSPGLHLDRSAQNSTSGRLALTPGWYVFVCDWAAGDQRGMVVVGSVEVTP